MTGMKFSIKLEGARAVERKINRTSRLLDKIVDKRVTQAGDFMVEKIYRNRKIVPYDTGNLSRGIGWTRRGRLTIEITGHAFDPDTGFDYFPTSRFGHETHLIVPIHHFQDEAGILHWETKGGEDVFSTFSRGFHPTSDWTEKGAPLAREVVRRTGKLIANDVIEEFRR